MASVWRRRVGRRLVLFQKSPSLALAGTAIFGRIAIAQTVGIAGRLPVAEIGTMPTAADATRHSWLFDRFADEDAIFFKLFRQNSVEKWIAARIEWQNENGKDFGLFQRNEL